MMPKERHLAFGRNLPPPGGKGVENAPVLPQKCRMISADAFVAIADPNRRYLLEELRRGPKTVGQLAAGLPVSRPAVSQHLKVLLDAGLVEVEVEGTRRVYAVSAVGFTGLNLWLDQFWQA
jgi:DNA-binding transcriptional ArsR family regulator